MAVCFIIGEAGPKPIVMIRGTIFNIQKYSIHDGPGIRTAVFFKGCPLRCIWCSNPESQSMDLQILWDKARCIHCLACVDACPSQAITHAEGRIQVNHCTGCKVCTAGCPGKALSLTGELRSVAEVMAVCLEDQVFYEESGGGVTLTGGEVLSQSEFAEALLTDLGAAGIHRTIETSGFAAPDVFNRIADKTDLILFDIKHHRREKHHAFTGAYQDRIIKNFQTALAQGRKILPRIPVIPGCNDSLEDAAAFAELLLSSGAKEVQLLPFHQFGQNKYRLLGMDYKLENAKALHTEKSFIPVFDAMGIRTVGN